MRIHPPPSPQSSLPETSSNGVYDDNDNDAANNGFGQRSLHQWEGRLLYIAGYPAPSHFRAPGG
jgi:hypothetical protein